MSMPCKTCGASRTTPCATWCGRRAKQVIVMRKDLNMRKGKMVAQGSHASLGAVLMIQESITAAGDWHDSLRAWLNNAFTKVCVSVDSEQALMEVYSKTVGLGIPAKLITDAGHTEFHGVPTRTCIAIGPYWVDDIDKVTGELPLL
jgi:peptidyl-tRNA hydrolase, PTH2 family